MTAVERLRDEYVSAVGSVETAKRFLALAQHELELATRRRDSAHAAFLEAKAELEAR